MKSAWRRIGSIAVFLAVWEIAVWLELLPVFLVAAPSAIAAEFVSSVASGTLTEHIVASMTRMLIGYGIALVAGILLGGLMGWFRWLDDIIDPIIELFRPVSPLALLPLAILWLGIGQGSKILVIWYGCFFPILLNTYAGVRSVPKSTIEAARTLGAAADEMLRRVVFYHSLPMVFTGARISFAVGMIVIIASEMVAADSGLGYMMLTAQQTFRTTELYLGIATIAVIGFAGDRVIRWLRARICPWFMELEQS